MSCCKISNRSSDLEKLKESNQLEDIDVDGRTILNRSLISGSMTVSSRIRWYALLKR